MASNPATIVLVAGSLTFFNEWWQAREIEWRIPVATVIGAAIIEGLATVNSRAASGLAIIILLGAVTSEVKGKSVADSLYDTFQPRNRVAGRRTGGKPSQEA